jgi:HD-like signal output (HDOD) protein
MLIVNQTVLDDIGRGFSVPAQPKLLLELLKLMAEPSPDINAIAEAISKDIAVSASILKAINSPRYGLARTITDIKMSVNYIGIYGVIMLITGSLLKKSFDPINCSINLEKFWLLNSDIANIAMSLGKKLKPTIANDKFFSLGLFHDCGIPVMSMKYKNYQESLDQATSNPDQTLTTIEEDKYKVNHAVIGYFVASSWRIPRDVCKIILQHHDRDFLNIIDESQAQDLFAILKLSEHIAALIHTDFESDDWPFIKEQVMVVLKLDDNDIKNLITEENNTLYAKII